MARYLVDGMNVIGARPDGWWRDRDAAAVDLVRRLVAWAAGDGQAAQVTVVFDGDRPPALGEHPGVSVVFAGRGASADDEIARRALDDPDAPGLTVVTSDAELARRVRAPGAAVIGAGGFRRRIDRY